MRCCCCCCCVAAAVVVTTFSQQKNIFAPQPDAVLGSDAESALRVWDLCVRWKKAILGAAAVVVVAIATAVAAVVVQ